MVAAESQAAADFAVTRITVEYDELPVAASLEGALARDAPLIHEEAARPGSAHGLGRLPDAEGNICYSYSFRRGDVDRAFAEAAVVVEGEYTFPAVYQYSMETHTTIAHWHGGELTLWSSCQHPFLVRQEIAALFGLPLDLRPYRWQAVQVQAHCVYTNTGPAGSYRAFGATHLQWIGESQLDEVARRLDMDRLEIRRHAAQRHPA